MYKKNNCLYCANESDDSTWCNYFNEKINPLDDPQSRARRNQDKCKGFQIDPAIKSEWEKEFPY